MSFIFFRIVEPVPFAASTSSLANFKEAPFPGRFLENSASHFIAKFVEEKRVKSAGT